MPAVRKVAGLNCPNCGAPQTIRGFAHTLTVVCPNCQSVLDARDPNFQVLQRVQQRQRRTPAIPLGQRGKLRGGLWEVIGYQVRTTHIEGTDYSWREYVLFNPYQGFRYLTEYDGHWNFVKSVNALPEMSTARGRPAATYGGTTYRHFQTGTAETTFVLGEFPWQVRVGESVGFRDYIAPPFMLSAETTASETTWSHGEYINGAEVWQAFQLPGQAPSPTGIFANQPAPRQDLGGMWTACMFLLLTLAVLALGVATFARNEEVFRATYLFSAGNNAFVTPTFELKGRTADVEVATRTDPSAEAFFSYALINTATGNGYDFGREVDGRDSAVIPSVSAGQYYLRVEPETPVPYGSGSYEIRVRRDVPVIGWYWIAGLFILLPPALKTFRSGSFEARRWQESDYGSN